MSHFLSPRELKTIERVGTIYLPGDAEKFPSFKNLNCVFQIDEILESMDKQDLVDLKLLFRVLSFTPTIFLKLFIFLCEGSTNYPKWLDFIGSTLRLVRLGLRGIVFSLYYDHPEIHQKMNYSVNVYMEDLTKETSDLDHDRFYRPSPDLNQKLDTL